MRREVLAPLMNEKVTYIELKDDLWVTFDPWFFIFQGGFWPFIFPKWLLEFLFSFNYNNSENMKTLHIPHFWTFTKKNIYIFYNITILILLSCENVCSMPRAEIISFPLWSWRCVLSLHRGQCCISCTPCWLQTFARMRCSGSTPLMALQGALRYLLLKIPSWFEPPP